MQLGSSNRSGTAVSTASNLNSHVDTRGKTADDSGHSTAECTAVDARVGGDDAPRRERKPCTEGAELDRDVEGQHAKFTSRCSRYTGPVRRGSDEVRGLVVQAEIVSRRRGQAVPEGADGDRSIDDRETQRDARQRRKRPQHPVVPHTRDDNDRISTGQVPQRSRERRIRSVEAVRHVVGAQASNNVRWTLDERALVQVQRRHSEQVGGSREARTRLREPVDEHIKIGVTMLGMEDMRVKEHLIRNSVRITSW